MSDLDTDNGLWAGIFAKLEASLGSLGRVIRRRNQLDMWAAPLWRPLATVVAVGATGPIVFNIGSPPPGYYWKVRSIQASGPSATAVSSVVVDVYIATPMNPSPGLSATGTTYVPVIADWFTSSSFSSNPGSLPVQIAFGSDEMIVNSGESLIVVLSGVGVSASVSQFLVGGYAMQHQGLPPVSED